MGGKQIGFGEEEQATARKHTLRGRLLHEMETPVPSKALLNLIEPHVPKTAPREDMHPR